MSEPKFNWVKLVRRILILPAAVVGILIWRTVADFLPQVGPELYLHSMYPPDHLYNVYLDSFMAIFVGLMSGAFMAPECRREVVVIGSLMMGGCGGLLDVAFLQSHFTMPHSVSVWSYIMSGLACLAAIWVAHRLDQRAGRQASLAPIDQPDPLG